MVHRSARASILAVAGLLGTLWAGGVQGQAPAPPPTASLSVLARQTIALFPEIEGDVVEVQGRTLTLSAGERAGAHPGLTVNVVRQGREIRHPRTGQVLGRVEEPVGHAVITRTAEGYSVATVDADGARVGDRVRSPGKIQVGLVSLGSPGVKPGVMEAASGELYEALTQTGRLQPVLSEQVAVWLAEQKVDAEDFLRGQRVQEALQRFKIEHLLVLHFKQVGRRPFLEARLFSAGSRDAALTTAFFVPPSVKPAESGQFSAATRPDPLRPVRPPQSFLARLLSGLLGGDVSEGYSRNDSIPLKEVARLAFTVVSMDVAVGPADKIPRVALTDGQKIWVYKLVNRILEGEWTYSARFFGHVVSVQLADLDGDGVLEVVANRHERKLGMSSLIVGLQDGKATAVVDHIDGILLAVDEQGAGVKQALWIQRYTPEKFFDAGQADRYVLRDGALVRDRSMVVASSFRATGATMSNLMGKGTHSLVFIDEQRRLRIASGSEDLWRSSSDVGGAVRKIEVYREIERGGRSFFHEMEPTPLAVDLDGDGLEEIVVPQNQIEVGVLAVVYKGPAGIRFQQVNSGFEGIVAGLGAVPGEDGPPTLITAVVRYKSFLKVSGETQIIMTTSE